MVFATILLFALLGVGALPAQIAPLLSVFGQQAGDAFGQAVGPAGDVDLDGVPDIVVGAIGADPAGTDSGQAMVVSGVDGQVIHTFDGLAAGDLFGFAVEGVGDADGDLVADVLVGAELADPGGVDSGAAYLFSGATGLLIRSLPGDAPNDRQGVALAATGDVNGDGRGDMIIGANKRDVTGLDAGAARVYSGIDGSVLFTFNGLAAGDEFGETVASGHDLDGDGINDFVVGGPFSDLGGTLSGMARAFSGANGAILHTWAGLQPGDRFGSAVGLVSDLDGDGRAEVVIGAALADLNGTNSGSAWVYSGQSGLELFRIDGSSPGAVFGGPVRGAGDVNGDGFEDILVGARGDTSLGTGTGALQVFSGMGGGLLFSFAATSSVDLVGESGAPVGDLNGDGFADVALGAVADATPGTATGSLRVITGCRGRGYGLQHRGDNLLGLDWLTGAPGARHAGLLRVSGAPPGATGFLFGSPAAGQLQLGAFTVLVDITPGSLASLPLAYDASGDAFLPLDLRIPSLAGAALYTQAVAVQPTVILGSNGLELGFCP